MGNEEMLESIIYCISMIFTLTKWNFNFWVLFVLLSANAMNLDKFEILLFGKEVWRASTKQKIHFNNEQWKCDIKAAASFNPFPNDKF